MGNGSETKGNRQDPDIHCNSEENVFGAARRIPIQAQQGVGYLFRQRDRGEVASRPADYALYRLRPLRSVQQDQRKELRAP